MSQGRSTPSTSLTSYGLQQAVDPASYQPVTAAPEQREHFWRNVGIGLLGPSLIAGVVLYWRHLIIQSQLK